MARARYLLGYDAAWLENGRSTLDLLDGQFSVAVAEGATAETVPLRAVELSPEVWARIAPDRHPQAVLVRPDQIVAAVRTVEEVLKFYGCLFSG